MGSRIEAVEVLSFRLELPRLALERLPVELSSALPVQVAREDDGSLTLEQEGQESFLRFQLEGDAAELVEIFISQDAKGAFFHKVLGALMVRYHGDLRARLVFDPRENEADEPWAEVSIERGRTTWPGLATQSAAVRLAHAAAEGGSVGASGEGGPVEEPLTQEEEELSRILARADEAWQEYQRLKRQRQQPR
ncbi:hypothetical protein [Hyalangium rubrum]|uniref:Uncharacterized protein n=1 Tax=Hyalangium rubrum TaxID=3103134 RepID=A0ABU5H4K3_9BACT|nr:hypothetical protein [Hyalangium sp. s54d21]MDY7228410.1 hypothetical protein [Hyalangium sp. s54d21]